MTNANNKQGYQTMTRINLSSSPMYYIGEEVYVDICITSWISVC